MQQQIFAELPPSPFRMGEAMVYHTPVAVTGRGPLLRRAEQEAVARLVRTAFGDSAILTHDEDGAPEILGAAGVNISISHCSGLAVLAVSHAGRIGIDVEIEDERVLRAAPRVLTTAEQGYDLNMSALTAIWTAKEATFKALGSPSLVISEIEISGSVAVARALTASLHHRTVGPLHITLSTPAQ